MVPAMIRMHTGLVAAAALLALAACDTTDDATQAQADTTADVSVDVPSAAPTDSSTAGPDTATRDTPAAVDAPHLDVAPPVDVPPVDTGPVEIPEGPIGGDRPAAVNLPSNYDPNKAYPLVMLLHGFSANGTVQDAYLQLSPQVDTLGFIQIIPEGTKNPEGKQFWNANPRCCNFYNQDIDDSTYLTGLVAEAKQLWNVDARRVYLIGHSNGGYMSYRLACDHSEVFTALVSIAGATHKLDASCGATDPVSVLQVHGTLDQTILYPSGPGHPGAVETVEKWASYNGCMGAPTTDAAPLDLDDGIPGAETTIQAWNSCAGGSKVALWTIDGGGHIPGFGSGFAPAALGWLLDQVKAP